MATPGSTPLGYGRGRTRITRQITELDPRLFQNSNVEASTSPTGSRPYPPRSVKAPTVISIQSSTSTRIKQNRVETERKIAVLEEEIETKKEELYEASSNLQIAELKLARLEKAPLTEKSLEEVDRLQVQIIELKGEMAKRQNRISSLERSFERRKRLIVNEADLLDDIIREGEEPNDVKSSENEEEKHERIVGWVNQTQGKDNLEDSAEGDGVLDSVEGHASQLEVYSPPVEVYSAPHQDNTVAQLVTALSQAFPSQNRNSVVTKSIDKDLPYFDGRPEDWLTFKSKYDRTTAKYQYDDSENAVRLRRYLKGNAKDAVAHLLANPINVKRIVLLLERRFGNPEQIIFTLMDQANRRPRYKHDLVWNENYLNDVQLLNKLVEKLPGILHREWLSFVDQLGQPKNLEIFQQWIEREVNLAYSRVKPKSSSETRQGDRRKGQIVHAAKEVGVGNGRCHHCGKQDHVILECPEFLGLGVNERWKSVRGKGLCYNCLWKGHLSTNCKKKGNCGIDSCTTSHHRLLHRIDKYTSSAPIRSSSSSSPPQPEVKNTLASAGSGSMPVIPVKLIGPAGSETVLALLDTGASFSMLEKEVADRIGLEGEWKPLSFNVFGQDVREDNSSTSVNLTAQSVICNSNKFQLRDVRTVQSIGLPPFPLKFEELKKRYDYLQSANVKSVPNKPPRMIIGYDNHRLFCPVSTIEDPEEVGPSAHLSRLGWYISGVTGGSSCAYACDMCKHITDEELHQHMKDFFSVEEKGKKSQPTPSRSKEDQRALQLLEENSVRVGDRWQTCLLWKEDNPALPPTKNMAISRLKLMEKKMDNDEEFAKLCCDKFQDYIDKGYLVPAELVKDQVQSTERRWFLPWFFAYHATKKPRLVFDAAAKSEGKSLNDFLLKGPDMLNSLPEVLMRFRSHHIALASDIKEMFHRVKLRPEDWPSQTILFRGMERDKRPKEYFMTVLFFGAASSPCSAIYVKDKNAEVFAEKYPAAVAAIKTDFYMDDYLGGAKTEEEAIKLQQEITEIHQYGGFEICKWNSSFQRVLEAIPENLRAERAQNLALKSDVSLEKTLGMWWNPEEDVFQFKLNLNKIPKDVSENKRHPTKREVTSFVMALFDSLGFLSPVKVRALMIIQNIWRSGIGWDVEVSNNVNDQWKKWLVELDSVRSVKIPRRYSTEANLEGANLHVFVDASEEAYSCAIYLLWNREEQVEMSFVAGKARVALLKGLTIPRMELEAALTGARLAETIQTELRDLFQIKRKVYWSDSRTVLCWIRSDSGRFKTFVQTRVGEIAELSKSSEWKWVPTKKNVADDATRSIASEEFSSSCRWLKGVDFLLLEEKNWPEEKSTAEVKVEELELRKVAYPVSISQQQQFSLLDISKYSSWLRLIMSTAAVICAARKMKKIQPRHITVHDMRKAQKIWIRKVQHDSFSPELAALRDGRKLPKLSRLASFSPCLNEDEVIVLGGRIDAAIHVPVAVRRPPIMDPAHPYTKLFLKWLHEISGHHGQERAVSEARKKFWIVDCQKLVRSTWANCQKCKLRKLDVVTPEMGPLPACRLGEGRSPYYLVGVDYFGPLQVRVNRSTVKRWGVIFTCMSTRAVHFELAEGMDTSEMLNVLARFIAVRGAPSHIWSDNGRNFVGANRELKSALEEWNQDQLCRAMSIKGVEWHFNPPASPHMGGSIERLIGSAKKILSSLLKSQAPKESVLRTLLYEAMDIMNSRPLSHASTDPDDPECLTPNHLLRMKCLDGPPLPGQFCEKDKYRASWRYCQHLANEFWKRWTEECLPNLAIRKKWRERSDPVKVGDVVIVKDDQVPRSAWKKGIIERVFPGKDGQVRIVDVRVAIAKVGEKADPTIKVYRRPAVKIIPIGESTSIVSSDRYWEEECGCARSEEAVEI